jgi:predicted nucleotidyltransferase
MVDFAAIQTLCDDIVRAFHPQKVILFGSYAYDTATADSDVDLLVVMPFSGHPAHKVLEIRRAIRAPFPLDLLVRTPADVQARVQLGDFFLREIVEKGRTLYETSDRGMGQMKTPWGRSATDSFLRSGSQTRPTRAITRDCR